MTRVAPFQEEFRRLLNQLEVLKEKNILLGNQDLVGKLAAMLEASNRIEAQVSTIQAISTSIVQLNDLNKSTEETSLGQTCQEQKRAGRKENLSSSLKDACWIFRKMSAGLRNAISKLAIKNEILNDNFTNFEKKNIWSV